MDSTRPIFLIDYVDQPFDEVCRLLGDWQDQRVTAGRGRQPIAHTGHMDRIADHLARVTMFDDDGDPFAELRTIAVSTGHDALTEVLVFMHPVDDTAAERSIALGRARSILEGAVRRVEQSARHAVSRRAG